MHSAQEYPELQKAKTKVLVVEDDPSLCRILESFLRQEAYQVTSCNTAPEGLDLLNSVEVDDRGAAHSEETARVQLRLQRFQRLADYMNLRTRVKLGAVIRRLDPVNIFDPHEHYSSSFFNGDSS